MNSLLFLFLLLLAFPCYFSTQTYRAAVLEFSPYQFQPGDNYQLLLRNLAEMEKYISEAKKQGAQIIVLPEYGLEGWYEEWDRDNILPILEPLPNYYAGKTCNPCLEKCKDKNGNNIDFKKLPVLKEASCIAMKYSIIIAIDGINDVQYCENQTDCPPDGRFQFNTLVVLDEQGFLVAKYHKGHNYESESNYFDQPKTPEIVYFDSSFGVRFGMFICFDILWNQPTYSLVYELGISNILFPTYWGNLAPAFSANEFQVGFSKSNKVNFLASNIGYDGFYSSGSGIFSNGLPLAFYTNDTIYPSNRLLIADVPIIIEEKPSIISFDSNFLEFDDLSIPSFKKFQAIPGTSGSLFLSVSGVDCQVNYSISQNQSESFEIEEYALFAYSGLGFFPIQISFCGLTRCVPDPNQQFDCDVYQTVHSNTFFDSFEIESNLQNSQLSFAMANEDGLQIINDEYLNIGNGTISNKDGKVFKLLSSVFLQVFQE
ncbi:pantetheinase [Anaeramoeba ignava]|uniref:Pantetheinase n=1 Tax=Anaeramoeba ignava TaxID=1746090 RepID=A0A9Q0LR61_ANAIG|nr:pantetheinase [Anaeramoeba ignava]